MCQEYRKLNREPASIPKTAEPKNQNKPGCVHDLRSGCGKHKGSRIQTKSRACPVHEAVMKKDKNVLLSLLNNGANPDCFHGPDVYRSPLLETLMNPGDIDMAIVKMLVYYGASLQSPLYPHLIHYIMQSNTPVELLTFLIGVGLEMPPDFRTLMISIRNTDCTKIAHLRQNILNLISLTGVRCSLLHNGRHQKGEQRMKDYLYLNNSAIGLQLQDWCRITIRNILIQNSGGRFILPNLRELHLPHLLKGYISFDTFYGFQDFLKDTKQRHIKNEV